MNAAIKTLDEQLQVCCQKHLKKEVRVSNIKRLSGGASAETRFFELQEIGSQHSQKLILRSSSINEASQFSTTVDKKTEAFVQVECASQGIPVPDILFCLDQDDGLGDGYVMSCIHGETIPRKILRDDRYAAARENMPEQCAHILANIHSTNIDIFKDQLSDQSPMIQLRQLEALYRSYHAPSAVFELAFRWLKQHAPKGHRLTLVHGDFRNGNLVVDETGIVGVLDWELCHLGDPIEDLGWLCVNAWCFGSQKPVGGFGDIEALIDAYQKATRAEVSMAHLRYWQVFGTLRWGIICLFQAACFLKGLNRSVELAAIGRRVSEVEIDLINLFETVSACP